MRFGVDLALQNLFCARYGELGHLRPQRFLGAIDLLLDLRLGCGQDAIGLGLGVGARLLDRLAPEFLTLRNDVRGTRLGVDHHIGDAFFGVHQAMTTFFAGGQAVGDLLLPCLDRAHQRRPDEFRREQNEREKRDRLHQQRQVDVHDWFPCDPYSRVDTCPITSDPPG